VQLVLLAPRQDPREVRADLRANRGDQQARTRQWRVRELVTVCPSSSESVWVTKVTSTESGIPGGTGTKLLRGGAEAYVHRTVPPMRKRKGNAYAGGRQRERSTISTAAVCQFGRQTRGQGALLQTRVRRAHHKGRHVPRQKLRARCRPGLIYTRSKRF